MNTPTCRLLLLPAAPDATATCLRLDGHGRVLERLSPTQDSPLPPSPERTVVAVPGAAVRVQWLALEAHSEAQALAAARARVADELAGSATELHVSLGGIEADGERMVLATEAAAMHGWLAQAAALGASVEAMLPDSLLPPIEDGAVQVLDRGDAWLVRGPRLAFSAEPALAACVIGDRAHMRIEDPARIEALLAAGALAPAADLLQGAFARDGEAQRVRGSWRRVVVLAGLLALSPLLLVGTEAARASWSARGLEASAAELAAEVAPEHFDPAQAATVPPAEATARALAAGNAGDTFAREVHALFAAVAAQPGMELDRLQYAPGRIEATVRHRDAAALATLLGALEAAGLPAEAADTRPQDGGLASTLRLGGGA